MSSIGPLGPGTTVNDITVGTVDWVNPNNAQAQDDVNADFTSTSGGGINQISHYLKATNFGFSVPAGSVINGILMEIRKRDPNDGVVTTYDSSVKIVKGGSIGTTEKKNISNTWTTTYNGLYISGYWPYGSSSDLWGEVWTPSDINSSTFGVVIAATIDIANSLGAQIDYIRATVTYTPPPTPSPNESITITENTTIYIINQVFSVSEQVTVSESENILIPILKPSFFDLITVSENEAFAILNYGQMLDTENITVSESTTFVIPVLFISVFDLIVTSENTNIAPSSLLVPLLIFESVTVSDVLSESTFINLLSIETLTISENISVETSVIPGYNMPGSTPQGSMSRWGGLTIGGGL